MHLEAYSGRAPIAGGAPFQIVVGETTVGWDDEARGSIDIREDSAGVLPIIYPYPGIGRYTFGNCRVEFEIDELNSFLKELAYGDVNADGVFNSGDLVEMFVAGTYEDGVPDNANWRTCDTNNDLEFSTPDLVRMFQGGAYQPTAVAVPEPSPTVLWLAFSCVAAWKVRPNLFGKKRQYLGKGQ